MVEIIAKDVPDGIMRTLVGEARHRDETIQERAVSILSLAFGVERKESGRRFIDGSGRSSTLVLTVPIELRDRIRRRALELDGTIRGIVISTIAAHFGQTDVPTGRRPRGGN